MTSTLAVCAPSSVGTTGAATAVSSQTFACRAPASIGLLSTIWCSFRTHTAKRRRSAMSERYDAIILGGGHNGLTCGAYLARAGLRTVVLERRPVIGGAAVTEEIVPGFRFSVFSYLMSLLHPKVIAGLRPAQPRFRGAARHRHVRSDSRRQPHRLQRLGAKRRSRASRAFRARMPTSIPSSIAI